MPPPPTILVGIDEAGYGPTLGPLCVGMSVFAVPRPDDGQLPVPDLWKLLAGGICREPGRGGKPDAKGRIAIADSKELKLSSSIKTTHPLVHLERGVLTMLATAGHDVLPEDDSIPNDARVFAALGSLLPSEAWYVGEPIALPFVHTVGQLRIAASLLDRSLRAANVNVLAMKCRVMGEREFNHIATHEGGKGATTAAALREHLRFAWDRWGPIASDGRTSLGIVCDRQGGRAAYAGLLKSALPDATISIVEESDTRSRYIIEGINAHGAACKAGVVFLVEGERHHLPVALASMIAKFTREVAMMRFNRYWGARASASNVELKPTAGYALDAGRWLREAREIYSSAERTHLVRIA